MSETAIKDRIMQNLKKLPSGNFFWRQGSSMYSMSGVADILGVCNGQFIALEVKQPGKKTTPNQDEFIKCIREAGGIAEVVTSWSDVENVLKQLKEETA